MTEDNRPLNDYTIEERITMWRRMAREAARFAETTSEQTSLIEGAALATMYLAFAADAQRFGELPEVDETNPLYPPQKRAPRRRNRDRDLA